MAPTAMMVQFVFFSSFLISIHTRDAVSDRGGVGAVVLRVLLL